ncbi:MAG: sulfite exporter TauE/SafE family protein [Gemmatimonadales bacterium]
MSVAGWLAALAVGLLAGAVSGLVGIGGGAVMVPFLYYFLANAGLAAVAIPPEHQAVIAHATSLLVIVPISVRGAFLYSRAGLVEWGAVWRMGIASVFTAVLGARTAVVVPGELLKLVFGTFLIVIATRLLRGKKGSEEETEPATAEMHNGRAIAGGAAVGFFSALLGVGGGLVAIPVLIYGLHVNMRKVTGTSLALITFTALTGVLAYAISGVHDYGAVAHYFHLPAALALAVGALVAVPLGAAAQMKMPTRSLRYMFAVVFLLLGLRILMTNLIGLLGR